MYHFTLTVPITEYTKKKIIKKSCGRRTVYNNLGLDGGILT